MYNKALLIGNNHYPFMSRLDYAEDDAKAVAACLQKHYGFRAEDVALMTSRRQGTYYSNLNNMKRKLTDLCEVCQKSDRLDLLVLGFFGHGCAVGGERYLCGTDADAANLQGTSLPLSFVLDCVEKIGAATTVLFLDCCQNSFTPQGGTDNKFSDDEADSFRKKVKRSRDVILERRQQNATVAILNSCSANQCAYSDPAFKHGVFTYYLLKALRSRKSTADECFRFISDRMRAGNYNQVPFYSCEGDVARLLPDAAEPTPSWKKTLTNALIAVGILGVGMNWGNGLAKHRALRAPVVDVDALKEVARNLIEEQDARETAEKQLAETQEKLAAAELAEKNAKKELASEKSAREAAEKQVEVLKQSLTGSQSANAQTDAALKTAKEELAAARSAQETAEQAEKDAKKELASEKSARETAEKQVEELKQSLTGSQSANAQTDAALKTAKEELAKEQAAREAAEKRLDETKQELTNAQNAKQAADKLVAETQEKLAEAEQAAKETAEQRASEQKAVEEATVAKAGDLKTVTVNGVEYRFRWCPAGSFDMGSNDGLSDEKPVHKVTLTRGFWMMETEVTQKQWESLMGANPSYFSKSGNYADRVKGLDTSNFPVENVSWNAIAGFGGFIEKLNATSSGLNFRLPTEAEWEYAARSGQNYTYSGSNEIDDVAWYGGNSGNRPHEVGTKTANGWGLFDMNGNVWEWCSDWHGRYYYVNGPVSDPEGPTSGSFRVSRGGSWNYGASRCRCAYRNCGGPEYSWSSVGFRLLLESVR